MSRVLDIVMAGVISGIVAFTTSQLGVAGTVIGAVIGSMLYQLMNHFFRKPIDSVDSLRTQKVESSVFYVFPLIIILGIEILYLFSLEEHQILQKLLLLNKVLLEELLVFQNVFFLVKSP